MAIHSTWKSPSFLKNTIKLANIFHGYVSLQECVAESKIIKQKNDAGNSIYFRTYPGTPQQWTTDQTLGPQQFQFWRSKFILGIRNWGVVEYSGCFNTPLEHTPKPFTNRLKRDFFHSWLGGLPGVCSRGVLKQPLNLISLESMNALQWHMQIRRAHPK